jgi:alkylation response protein AidB-like acyl-CoA dehydrogenase
VLAAAGLGLLNESRDEAVEHARGRQQFGTNIGQFQGVQWKLADMECDRIAASLLVYRAAWSLDEEPKMFRQYASMCKFYAIRAARFHSGEAIQIMGAAGIEDGADVARFYDDAKTMEVAQGTAEFQKMLLVKELNI